MSTQPRFIFFGTPEFAADVLEKLLNRGVIPVAIVCNPDKPVGRKKTVTPPAVKLLVLEHQLQDPTLNIPLLQPEKLDDTFIKQLKSFEPDLFVIAAYAKLVKQNVLDVPKYGTLGVHPSLLPAYRGTSPMQTALLDGQDITGISLFMIDEKMDHGPIVTQETVQIGTMNYTQLAKKLAEIGGELVAKAIPGLLDKTLVPQEQDHTKATFTRKFTTEDAFIDVHALEQAHSEGGELARAIERKIRALNPEPGVWTMASTIYNLHLGREKRVKLLDADISMEDTLIIKKIHIEGKRPLELRGPHMGIDK